MRWRIDTDKATGVRKRKVAIIVLDADQLDHIASAVEARDEGQLAYDLRTCHSALIREEIEGRR